MSINRDFKGVWIPKDIWLDENLSITEKCLIIEIDSLDNTEKGCFASNEYLGKFIGLNPRTIANMIVDLRKKGYLIQCFFDGRNRGLSTKLKSDSRHHEKVTADITKKLQQTSRKSDSRHHEKVNILIQDNNKDYYKSNFLEKLDNEREKKTKISEKNIPVDFSSFQNGNNCNGKKENPPCSAHPPLSLEERDALFYDEVMAFDGKYTQEMLVNFYNYWSEATVDKKMMKKEIPQRGQKHATWDTSKRLATWASRENKDNNIKKYITKSAKSSIKEHLEQYERISSIIDSGNF